MMERLNRQQRRQYKNMAGTKQKLIISNLCYNLASPYPSLWLENQLKSLCDQTNLPALRARYDLEYVVFTDEPTLQAISRHPNFMALGQQCEIQIVKMNWPADSDQFASRYQLLVQMFHQVLPVALEKGAWLGCWVADLVFAKHSLPKMLMRLEQGHDAVFNVPIRGAADSTQHILSKMAGAPTDLELFEIAYNNLHHLWVASDWDANLFSKFPYSMVWNSGTGLVAHNFGITPILFKPTEEMRSVQGVIDSDVPAFCKNPYWAHDWVDAAVAGIEPLSNGHYPPFLQHRASPEWVAKWAKQGTQAVQAKNLHQPLFYPSAKTFANLELAERAQATAEEIQQLCGET